MIPTTFELYIILIIICALECFVLFTMSMHNLRQMLNNLHEIEKGKFLNLLKAGCEIKSIYIYFLAMMISAITMSATSMDTLESINTNPYGKALTLMYLILDIAIPLFSINWKSIIQGQLFVDEETYQNNNRKYFDKLRKEESN